jgi:hypothetical protein
VQAWAEGPQGAGNIALRLPLGVYGLDVDAYEGKGGAGALGALEAAYGPLPATWTVTSRGDHISGIRLFRAELPAGRMWVDEPAGHGAGIEAIHFGHRYAVVWPSVHPSGHKYAWWRPSPVPGAAAVLSGDGEVPRLDELPALPAAWIEALSVEGEARVGAQAGHAETLDVVRAWREGDACPIVERTLTEGLGRLREARDGAALHPAGRDATHALACLGHEGHAGVRVALARHHAAFVEVRAGRDAGGERRGADAEWWRMVRGAVGKLTGAPLDGCDCDVWSGAGLIFDPHPVDGPVDNPAGSLEHTSTTIDLARATEVNSGGEGLAGVTEVNSGGEGAGGQGDAVDAFLNELVRGDDLAARPAPVPLVAGLLFRNTLAWLIGESGSFKSFVALDIAQRVAQGQPWAGRATQRGLVLYVVAEGAGGVTLRLRAWRERHGELPVDVLYLTRPVQAGSGGQWDALLGAVIRLRPSLVIIDTQARSTLGIKENDNTEMGRFVEQLDRLRRASGGACVLVVHHIGRGGDHARGASSIDGAQDTELKVTRRGGPKALEAQLVVDKQKDAPDTATVDLRLDVVDLGRDPTNGEQLSSLVVCTDVFLSAAMLPWREGLAWRQGKIIDIMIEMFSADGATGAQLFKILKQQGGTGDRKFAESSFYKAFDQLKQDGRIERIHGTQRWAVVPPGGPPLAPEGSNPFTVSDASS